MSDSHIVVVGISGSPAAPSRSRTLLGLALDICESGGAESHVVDLTSLPADALLGRGDPSALDAARNLVARSHVLIASTPVYRATYSGLLKVFFDQLPLGALAGKVALGIATGGSPRHAGVLEFGLRPLFTSLDAIVPFSGLHALDSQFTEAAPSAQLQERLAQLVRDTTAVAVALAGGVPTAIAQET
jgi:FMN reductase